MVDAKFVEPYLEHLSILNCSVLFFALFTYQLQIFLVGAKYRMAFKKTCFAPCRRLTFYCVALSQCPSVLLINAIIGAVLVSRVINTGSAV